MVPTTARSTSPTAWLKAPGCRPAWPRNGSHRRRHAGGAGLHRQRQEPARASRHAGAKRCLPPASGHHTLRGSILMNRTALSRRHILRALGLAAGASMLPSLRPRNAWSQTPAIPKRIVFFYTMHGSIHNLWVPTGPGGSGAPAETSWALGPLHGPLAGWESKLTFLDGLNMKSADIQDYSPQPENAHIYGQCHSLTAITMASASLAGGISIDQKIAKDLGPVTFRPSISM